MQDADVERDFSLAEYAEAQIQSVFLNLYSWVSIA